MKNGVEVDVEFKDGKAVLKLEHEGSDAGASVEVYVKAKKLLLKAIDKIEEVIPGDQKPQAAALKLIIEKLDV